MSPFLWNSLPLLTPSHPSRLSQKTRWSSQCHTANFYWLFYIWYCICFNAILLICPTLSFSHCVHRSLLYVCVTIVALQIGSSVPFFYIAYICINIWFVCVFLTSLCTTGSRFIHLTRTDSNPFFSMVE